MYMQLLKLCQERLEEQLKGKKVTPEELSDIIQRVVGTSNIRGRDFGDMVDDLIIYSGKLRDRGDFILLEVIEL